MGATLDKELLSRELMESILPLLIRYQFSRLRPLPEEEENETEP